MQDLLLGFHDPLRRYNPWSEITSSIFFFVYSYKVFNIQHILMHECISLVYKSILSVEYFWVSSIHYVLNDMGKFVHLCLIIIQFKSFPQCSILLRLLIFRSFLSILTHHIFLANLVKSISHPGGKHLFDHFEFLNLHELNVFQWALWRSLRFQKDLLWQYWVCWRHILFFKYSYTLVHTITTLSAE